MKIYREIKFKRYLFIIILLFVLSGIVGFFVARVSGGIGKIPFIHRPYYEYFWHNLKANLFYVGISFISYGILSIPLLIINGFILGGAIGILSYQFNVWEIMWLFNHGIFELPAFFLSIYLGKSLAYDAFSMFRRRSNNYLEIVFRGISMIIVISLLLIMASIIESIPK